MGDRGIGVFTPSSILHIGILCFGIPPISIFHIFLLYYFEKFDFLCIIITVSLLLDLRKYIPKIIFIIDHVTITGL